MKKRITLTILILCVIIFTLFWIGSLIKCEILTQKYVYQFKDAYKEHTLLMECDTIKVLNYTSHSAKVYYITENHGSGSILYFKRANKKSNWEFVEWEVVWSDSGSADGYVWPYIR